MDGTPGERIDVLLLLAAVPAMAGRKKQSPNRCIAR